MLTLIISLFSTNLVYANDSRIGLNGKALDNSAELLAGELQRESTITVDSVSLNKSTTALAKGKTEQLVAIVSPSDATNKNLTWSSSDPLVATVDSIGMVTAESLGETTITVSTTDGNKTDSCDVTVTEPIQTLLADPSTMNLSIDQQSDPITLIATYTDGSIEDVTASATWTSKDPSVATVDTAGGSVTVTGVENGSTTITGTYEGKTATINVNVTPKLDHILVQPHSVSVTYGKIQAVIICAVYADDSKVDVTKSVTLVSDDPNVATIITGGIIKGISVGDTVVRGTYLGLDIDIPVTVTLPVTKLSADPSVLNLNIDGIETVTLTATYQDGTQAEVTGSATWKSNKAKIATVDEYGKVTGVAIGSTTITGTYGGKTATINVNVTPKLDHILVQPESVSVSYGKTQAVIIYAIYVDDSKVDVTQSVTLVSDDPSIATVTGGTINGICVGETVVRGTYLGQDIEIGVTVSAQLDHILVQPGRVSVTYGKTQAFKMYAVYTDDSKVDVTNSVILVSDDPKVATVTWGIIKGISVGGTVVRGTYYEQDIKIPVTVTQPVTKLSADTPVLNLTKGGSDNITLTATYKDGTEAEVTGSATWKSSKPKIATVDEYGMVTGKAKGSTTITGKYEGKTATIKVNVTSKLDILVRPGSVGVAIGKTQAVSIFAEYENGSKVDITKTIRLTSDDKAVATVIGATIKGIKANCDTIVRGTILDQEIEIPVKVTPAVKNLTADTTGLNLGIDDSETITLTATYADGTEEDVNEYATGISSKPSVATVNIEDGVITVTAVARGSAKITLSYEGKKVIVNVKVTK